MELNGRAKIHIEKDNEHAVYYLRKAAQQGLPGAAIKLAELYIDGKLSPTNDSEVIPWLFQLAAIGNYDAHLALGRRYLAGTGVAADPAEAARWFQQAAEGGNGHAQFELALLHLLGSGLRQDTGEALRLLILARATCPDCSEEFLARFNSHCEEV